MTIDFTIFVSAMFNKAATSSQRCLPGVAVKLNAVCGSARLPAGGIASAASIFAA